MTTLQARSFVKINGGSRALVNLAGAWTFPNVTPVVDLFKMAPAEDVPTITVGASGASVLKSPIITTSAGWFREKRVGVAENVVGVNQTSTAELDFDATTRYRYLSVPRPVAGSTSNAPQYVATPLKPGGSPQAAYWLFNPEFITSSPRVSFRLNAVAANPTFGMIYVNGYRISELATRITATAGSGIEVVLTFPDARPRNICVKGMNNGQGRWGGVGVEGGYTVERPTATPEPLLAIIGDSWVNGASSPPDGAGSTETYVWRLAAKLGTRNVLQAGIGGTGYVQTIGGLTESVFGGRVDAVLAMNPDILIFSGGRNDGSNDIQTAVESCLSRTTSVPQRYVVSTAANSQTIVQNSMIAAAASQGIRFIDVDRDSIPKGADGIHPTFAGHQQLADQLYASFISNV